MAWKLQQGLTLIEVMVALAVTGSGLLAVAGLQWRALQGTDSALMVSQAAWLAQGTLEESRSPGGVDRARLQRLVDAFAGPMASGQFHQGMVSIGWSDARAGGGWREVQLGGGQ